jgi:hypothetical protein
LKVIVFTTNNARFVEVHPKDIVAFQQSHPGCVVNPDLSKLMGVRPHHWKVVDGKIVEMEDHEKEAVREHHEKHGVDNNIHGNFVLKKETPLPEIGPRPFPWHIVIPILGFLGGMGVHWLVFGSK